MARGAAEKLTPQTSLGSIARYNQLMAATCWTLVYMVAAVQAVGEPCQLANSKLDPNSHKFRSDCGPMDYCAPVAPSPSTSSSSNPASSKPNASQNSQGSNVGDSNKWSDKGESNTPGPDSKGPENIASAKTTAPSAKGSSDKSGGDEDNGSKNGQTEDSAADEKYDEDRKQQQDDDDKDNEGDEKDEQDDHDDEESEDGSNDAPDSRMRYRRDYMTDYLEPVYLLGSELHLSKRNPLSNVFLAAAQQRPIFAVNSSSSTGPSNWTTSAPNLHAPIVAESENGNAGIAGNGTGICRLKGCRRDEFPFGYAPEDVLPPRCPLGQFCPDEEDYCRTLLPQGSACQLNRDDQCLPAANGTLFTSESNFNGSICLSFTCMYADRQAGETCIIDNTVYSGLLPNKHNCAPGLYCSSDGLVCIPGIAVGQACQVDMQCLSGNCDTSNVCVAPPETPAPIPKAVIVLAPLLVIAGLAGMVYSLYTFHQKARKKRSETLHEYWTEQLAYRRTLINMHLAAQQEERRELLNSHHQSRSYTDSDWSDPREKESLGIARRS